MQAVKRHLQAVFGSSGTRVIDMPDGSLLLYDCPEWSSAHACRLLARYPDAEIDVSASSLPRLVGGS